MAGNKPIRDKAKLLWIKSMKTIGDTAANIANNTKFKVDEMTLQNRRRELAANLSDFVYVQWMKGETFPPEVTKMLQELQELDNRLNDMRAEKYSQSKAAEPVDSSADGAEDAEPYPAGDGAEDAEAAAAPAEETAEDGPEGEEPPEDGPEAEEEPEEEEDPSEAITGASPSLRSEINGCFDEAASVDKMAEKVNTSLDQLTGKIRAFSSEGTARNPSEETE